MSCKVPLVLVLGVAISHGGYAKQLANHTMGCRLKIITGGDVVSGSSEMKAIANQQAFARRHDYQHEVHIGNYAHPWTPYWHKIHALLHELRTPPSTSCTPEVLVWTDLDVVMTNPPQAMLDQILFASPRAALLLTEDPARGADLPAVGRAKRLVNTGIIIARRGAAAESILEKLFEYGRRHSNAAFLPQSMDTLHEQDAFNWLLGGPLGHLLGGVVKIMPQRHGDLNLNTFARNFYDDNYKDPEPTEWVMGDFTAHCSGLRQQLREWCIDDACAAAEALTDSTGGATGAPDSTVPGTKD